MNDEFYSQIVREVVKGMVVMPSLIYWKNIVQERVSLYTCGNGCACRR